jgi:uncharacterized protein YydD (DUF2326 family)
MLRRLSADDPRFKEIGFKEGLNLIVADVTPKSLDTDSRNSAGKSSIIELIHFLLGARADSGSLPRKRAIRDVIFSLQLDWPGLDELLTVRRAGRQPGIVLISPDIAKDTGRQESIFGDLFGEREITVSEWNALIEEYLFGLKNEHPGISGRIMLSFLIRRISSHAFNEAVRSFSRQSEAEATTNLAYLLGLDWKLASGYRDIAVREATRQQLRNAVNDPVWGRIVGSTADLRGQITIAEQRVARLGEQIATFRIVPEYENIRERADELGRQIRQLSNDDVIALRNLDHLQRSMEETTDVDANYLESVFDEVGVVLSDQVRRQYSDVERFHRSVIHNRRRYLSEEMAAVQGELAERRSRRESLGAEQAALLETMSEGGALEALTTLQTVLAREVADLEALRNRYAAASALEASAREIAGMRLQMQADMTRDLEERVSQTTEATLLFGEYAQALYGQGREAYLAIDAGRNALKISPRIDSDESRGIGNMVIFCFDLALAVIAHRHGRGPDFLVHDSHLFDGVDARQLASALALSREVCERESMQYVATLNSDALFSATSVGFDSREDVLQPILTDKYEDGGLFGFRF